MIAFEKIQQFTDEVARQFQPERIILFGSYAYGTPTEDSDVDLLVVMPSAEREDQLSVAIRMAIHAGFPMDLLVRDPQTLRYRIDLGDFFLQEITSKGRLLYERAEAGMD